MKSILSPQLAIDRITRIQFVSRIFMFLFFAGMLANGLFALCEVYLWLFHGRVVNDQAAPVFAARYSALENAWPLVSTVTLGLGSWFGFRLFAHFGRGQIFTRQNISNTKWITFIYFLVFIECLLFRRFVNRDYALHEAPVWEEMTLMAGLGILVLFIAWILDEGRRMQEEQALTV
jgi:Protein of unknown function (DUF2975)